MAGWFGSRFGIAWRYMRVSFDTWQEVGEYEQITGGSDEESYFTSVKEGGSLSFIGEPPSTIDLVRCYYEFTDEGGERFSVPVSTMFVDMTSVHVRSDGQQEGEASLYSVLKVAEDRLCGMPMTVAAGTNAVATAKAILEGLGLNVSATPSTYTVANDHVFKPDDSYLTVINWLLSAAGYGSASPDAYGTVVLAPYVDASSRQPSFVFEEGETSIMYPELDDENDYSETPNVCRMYGEDEYGGYWAVVRNVDQESPASLPSRGGRERTLYDEETQLEPVYDEDDTEAASARKALLRVEALVAIAKQKLVDNSSEIEYVTISHGFYPLTQGDSVEIRYEDMAWRGVVTNIKRDHNVESKCELKIRRYVQRDIKVEIQSGVIR